MTYRRATEEATNFTNCTKGSRKARVMLQA
jgi:hypothetical protein